MRGRARKDRVRLIPYRGLVQLTIYSSGAYACIYIGTRNIHAIYISTLFLADQAIEWKNIGKNLIETGQIFLPSKNTKVKGLLSFWQKQKA